VTVLTAERIHHNVIIQVREVIRSLGSRRREQIRTRTRVISRVYALLQKGR